MRMRDELEQKVGLRFSKGLLAADNKEIYQALLELTQEKLAAAPRIQGERKLYYISAEFLVGKLLSNNLINLGIYDQVKEALQEAGKDLAAVEEAEPEPSLGNGGLGRLAACYLDSCATLGLPGDGVGLLYHFGLFHQYFRDHKQQEEPDAWLAPKSWLQNTGVSFPVSFPQGEARAVLYDLYVSGYESGVNKLHLFDLEGVDESLVKGRHQLRQERHPPQPHPVPLPRRQRQGRTAFAGVPAVLHGQRRGPAHPPGAGGPGQASQ